VRFHAAADGQDRGQDQQIGCFALVSVRCQVQAPSRMDFKIPYINIVSIFVTKL
jgi:hypothetical protein